MFTKSLLHTIIGTKKNNSNKKFSKRSNALNASGFSLIELMVVVAIIGILAAIGIPQYSKFQAKTRQSEAKGALSSLYTAEVSFLGEWNQYSVNLKNIGFGVSGTGLRYITGFAPGTACAGYLTSAGAPLETPVTLAETLSCGANVNVAGPSQAKAWALSTKVTGLTIADTCTAFTVAIPTSVASSCTNSTTPMTFVAFSIGDPNASITGLIDGWTIDNTKKLSNPLVGIR